MESALRQHPALKESAVILWPDDEAENRQLVAYVVCDDPAPTLAEWQDFLRQRLPEYMLPQAYLQLDALPQTPTGKIDRLRLPTPDLSAQSTQAVGSRPRTPNEELLTALWVEVLKTDPIGIHDNFFALGGHSLLAVQVIVRVREAFQVDLSLRCLFEFQTIAELCKVLQTRNQRQADPMMPAPRHAVIPLSFGQQRLWNWQQLAGEQTSYKISYFRVLKGVLHQAALEQSFSELVARHESLRTTFPLVEGRPMRAQKRCNRCQFAID